MHFSHNKPVQPDSFSILRYATKDPPWIDGDGTFVEGGRLDVFGLIRQTKQLEVLCLPPDDQAPGKPHRTKAEIGPYDHWLSIRLSGHRIQIGGMVLAIVDGVDDLIYAPTRQPSGITTGNIFARELGTLLPVARNKQKRFFRHGA